MTSPTPLTHRDSIEIDAPPAAVWAVVSDVTRTGEWSPTCRRCEWAPGATGAVGDTFTGHNQQGEREWSTTSTVTASEPGTAFAWMVAQDWVRWAYRLEPAGEGTRLTETWEFTVTGLTGFEERYGEDAPAQVEDRTRAARTGIPETLQAIKKVVEAG
jgi:carbon monoxide dehydrogenase subunit G